MRSVMYLVERRNVRSIYIVFLAVNKLPVLIHLLHDILQSAQRVDPSREFTDRNETR